MPGASVTREEPNTEVLGLEARLVERMDQQETRLLAHMAELMNLQETRLSEAYLASIEKSETNLLLAFRKWAVRSDGKFKVHDLQISTTEERLNMLEHRIDDLERRDQA